MYIIVYLFLYIWGDIYNIIMCSIIEQVYKWLTHALTIFLYEWSIVCKHALYGWNIQFYSKVLFIWLIIRLELIFGDYKANNYLQYKRLLWRGLINYKLELILSKYKANMKHRRAIIILVEYGKYLYYNNDKHKNRVSIALLTL